MAQDSSQEENFKIRVVCPVCQKMNYVYLPKDDILSSKKGLSSVFIHSKLVCKHSFQIFVDKKGKVRGHETPDFELSFTPDEEETLEDLEKSKSYKVFLYIKDPNYNEIFLKCIQCIFNKFNFVCITQNQAIVDQFKFFFEGISGEFSPEIIVVTLEEYNKSIRSKIYGSKFKNNFVFDLDLNTIIKQPFEKKFKPEKFSLEKSLLNLINPETIEDVEIIDILQKSIKKIFDICSNIITLFKDKTLKNRKQMESKVQELLGDKIVYNADLIDGILKAHFNFIPQVFLLGF
jgi:hypothetical protein